MHCGKKTIGDILLEASVQSVLVPNPEMGIISQNVMASSAFPVYYSSQNGFAGAIHLSTTPRFPPMNLVEEYKEGLSNFLQLAILSPVDSMMIAEDIMLLSLQLCLHWSNSVLRELY